MKPPKPENENNPLRLLRCILGGSARPKTQDELSGLIGVPVPTIRAIEGGRRDPTWDNCFKQIYWTLLAKWDDQKKRWVSPWNPREPYDYRQSQIFLGSQLDHPYVRDLDLHVLILRMFALFEGIPSRQWNAMFLRVHEQLSGLAGEFKVQDRERVFELTQPSLHWVGEPTVGGRPTGHAAAYVKAFPWFAKHDLSPDKDDGGVLDFRDRRKSKPRQTKPKRPS